MPNDSNVISYKKLLANLREELAEFEACIIEQADPGKPLTLDEVMERLDIIERAYYNHLVKRIAQLERWLAVDEERRATLPMMAQEERRGLNNGT